jgi:hypothetical protein
MQPVASSSRRATGSTATISETVSGEMNSTPMIIDVATVTASMHKVTVRSRSTARCASLDAQASR